MSTLTKRVFQGTVHRLVALNQPKDIAHQDSGPHVTSMHQHRFAHQHLKLLGCMQVATQLPPEVALTLILHCLLDMHMVTGAPPPDSEWWLLQAVLPQLASHAR